MLLSAVRCKPAYAKAYHALGNLLSSAGHRKVRTHCTCFTGTNTDAEGAAEMALRFTHFTCFTGTKVPILTQKALLQGAAEMALGFAVRLQPDSADFCNSLGANLQLDGRVSDALVWYTRVMLTYADVCDACLVHLRSSRRELCMRP